MVVIGDLNRGISASGRAALVLVAALFMLFVPAHALAQTPFQDISSAGPLTDIWVGNDLSCQIGHAGDTSEEFYPPDAAGPADCGTFLSIAGANGSTVYGPDFPNHSGSAAGDFDTPFVAGAQSAVTGAGTPASPYEVTTPVTAGTTGVTVTEFDSYIVGNEFYRIDITVTNTSGTAITGVLSHAGDCYLQGSDQGYGSVDPSNNAPACTANPNNSPPAEIEEFSPITVPIQGYVEQSYGSIWSSVASGANLPNTCDCTTFEDNAEGINWDVSLPTGGSATYSMLADFSDTGQTIGQATVATGAATAVTGSSATLGGSVNPQGSPVTSCEFQWGTTTAYGNTAPCAQSPGSGTGAISVSAVISGLTPTTAYHFRTVATNAKGTSSGSDQTFTTPTPPFVAASPPTVTASSAAFSGSVNPEGLATSAHYEYGLDPKYSGGGPIVYTDVTPTVSLGAGTAAGPFNQSVSGLVPHALYHFRLVATNAAGTATGPDQTFTTGLLPPPPPPTLGQTENATPISGLVLIKFPKGKGPHIAGVVKGQGFIPLTQARQIPVGSQVDARRGTLSLVVATTKKRHTNSARLSGGVFSLAQQRSGPSKGLSTLALLENAFSGAPSYSSCTTKKTGKSVLAGIAKLNPKVLQTLSVSDNKGKFRTKGRYSAATERGTFWETQDRCDGTLTIVKRGTVNVQDFRTRKTIIVRAGHSFLAAAAIATTKPKKKKKK
jgi:hypothetical protein